MNQRIYIYIYIHTDQKLKFIKIGRKAFLKGTLKTENLYFSQRATATRFLNPNSAWQPRNRKKTINNKQIAKFRSKSLWTQLLAN